MIKKIGWFPGGDKNIASVRVRSYYIINYLKERGFEISINNPRPDLLVFQKCLVEEKLSIALKAKSRGKILIYDISDNVRSDMEKYIHFFKIAKEFILNAEKVVVNGIGLKKYFLDRFRKDAIVIEDVYPPEAPPLKKLHYGNNPKLMWHGYYKNMLMYVFGKLSGDFDIKMWKESKSEKPIDFRKFPYKLITVSNLSLTPRILIDHPTYLHPQDYPRLVKLILRGDIGISPLRIWDEDCFGKSANKIVSYMMLGIPTVATPVPAYQNVIDNGENGFLAEGKKEWLDAFEKLKDPKIRQKIGEAGFKSVVKKFSIQTIGQKWLKLLKSIA